MPKISVIVPIYNVEKYLCECLDSILSQTFKDFEVLLIDDGSTDNSPKIVDDYSKKDNRIIVYHRVNGGYGSACNFGLDSAKGEYISIIEPGPCALKSFINSFRVSIQSQMAQCKKLIVIIEIILFKIIRQITKY